MFLPQDGLAEARPRAPAHAELAVRIQAEPGVRRDSDEVPRSLALPKSS